MSTPATTATTFGPLQQAIREAIERTTLELDRQRAAGIPPEAQCIDYAGITNEALRAAGAVGLDAKAAAYDRIHTPEIDHFMDAVVNEALHQRERWGVAHDASKTPTDWFWLVGYLAGKALNSVGEKRLHHIITTGAALLNWHAQEVGEWAGRTAHVRQVGHDGSTCAPVKVRGEVRCACEFPPMQAGAPC